MKSALISLLMVACFSIQASDQQARIVINGEKAKNMIAYMFARINVGDTRFSGDGGMGKYFIQTSGIACRYLNPDHLEPEMRTDEKIFNCVIEPGNTGSVEFHKR